MYLLILRKCPVCWRTLYVNSVASMYTRLLYETEKIYFELHCIRYLLYIVLHNTFLAEHSKLNVKPNPLFSTFHVRCVGACSLKIVLEIFKMKYYKTISIMFCEHIKIWHYVFTYPVIKIYPIPFKWNTHQNLGELPTEKKFLKMQPHSTNMKQFKHRFIVYFGISYHLHCTICILHICCWNVGTYKYKYNRKFTMWSLKYWWKMYWF